MSSPHFVRLVNELSELQRVYLFDASLGILPTPELQERARAYWFLSHAEIEYFIECVCRDLGSSISAALKHGQVNTSSLAFITFSGLPSLNGGSQMKSGTRKLLTRAGEANSIYTRTVDDNDGIKERHLARLLVPLGLTSEDVDPSWLADIDSFATTRGAFAHTSRATKDANPASVNPIDILELCNRIVFRPQKLNSGLISSLEELDDWMIHAATISPASRVRRGVFKRMRAALRRWIRQLC